jgi:hypothetical protein
MGCMRESHPPILTADSSGDQRLYDLCDSSLTIGMVEEESANPME